jgi:hypothetical protein
MNEKEKEEMREFWSTGHHKLSESQIEMQIEQRENQEKIHKIEMRNELFWIFLFWPIFIGIWVTTAFTWGPLISLAIGWLPAFIGGGLVYLIFRRENEN